MRLFQIPKGSKIIEQCSDGSTYIIFDHIDGMYSYCTTEKGNIVHFSAYMPLLKEGDNYYISK